MSEFSQYISKLRSQIETLENKFPSIILDGGGVIIAEIMNRITQEGKDDEGKPFKAYTPSYLKFKQNPQETKLGKELGLGSSRYAGYVDYTLTGELKADIGLIEEEVSDTRVRYSYGAESEINKNKLKSLEKRDGDPLQPSESEVDLAQEIMEETIADIFNVR